MNAGWSNEFVGIPYVAFGRDRAGVDCWGLAKLVFAEILGIELPSYIEQYTSQEERSELDALIGSAAGSEIWVGTVQAATFDIVVFRRGHMEAHVGIVVSPGLMLHTSADDHSRLEHYSSGRWAHRLTGIYRHFEMHLRAAQ
ncbi:C40 family peptidase (plasmid) [Rhizobium lusitanum]|uniref:C40 family peptidase n=1 Tax=Rhizobium lusitanum TaxID=293958 RepID=UPI001615A90A|nr:NlpC/P60 family protein [Rhizobium lusitanum]QND45195.1 C40 family peptidase [Rhizobium lusitanum]